MSDVKILFPGLTMTKKKRKKKNAGWGYLCNKKTCTRTKQMVTTKKKANRENKNQQKQIEKVVFV